VSKSACQLIASLSRESILEIEMITNGHVETETTTDIDRRLKALEDKIAELETRQLGSVRGDSELERQVMARTAALQALNQELAVKLANSQLALQARERAENSLQDSQRFIQRIADASPNILYVYDIQEQRNIYVNHEIYKTLGYSPADIQSMGDDFFINLMHPEDLRRVPSQYAKIASGQDDEAFEFEYRMRHANGQWRWLNSRDVVFNRDADGRVKQTIGTAQDITDRKRLEQEKSQLIALLESSSMGTSDDRPERDRLERENSRLTALLESSNTELIRATRLKSEFLATISHEFRTPLNPIIGMSEALQSSTKDPVSDNQRRSLFIIETSGRQLLTTIERTIEASVNALGNPLTFATVEIAQLCHASLAAVQPLVIKKQIESIGNIPADLGQISIDERGIHRVLTELLNNAIKFNTPGNSVKLDVYWEEQDLARTLCFSISDTGIGIAPENFDKLFQPFLQLDSGLNRRYNGLGLGLTLAQQIVEQHGGSIEFTSELGAGSCFVVRLPSAR
jgi:PAS domain S-box-containing protein